MQLFHYSVPKLLTFDKTLNLQETFWLRETFSAKKVWYGVVSKQLTSVAQLVITHDWSTTLWTINEMRDLEKYFATGTLDKETFRKKWWKVKNYFNM